MKTNTNDPIGIWGMPNSAVTETGLTKREYFAACALQGIMADPTINDISGHKLAEHAVRLADALIVALNKEQG